MKIKLSTRLLVLGTGLLLSLSLYAQGRSHTVLKGETLEGIAQKYGVSTKSIIELNPDVTSMFYVGMKITIPDSKTADQSTSPTTRPGKKNTGKHSKSNRTQPHHTQPRPTQPVQTQPVQTQPVQTQPVQTQPVQQEYPTFYSTDISRDFDLYLAGEIGLGYSNYFWGNGDVYGTFSVSASVVGQLYLTDNVYFIPKNWYSELAIGYDKKGAANFGMHYIHARVYPLGYRIPISPVDLVAKGGVILGVSLNKFGDLWSSNFQIGLGVGLQAEWQQFSIGCHFEYDCTQVSSKCGQTLNNFAVLGTISYKFAKF